MRERWPDVPIVADLKTMDGGWLEAEVMAKAGATHVVVMARPGWQVWLGAGWHLSLEMVQVAGERITFYLWCPRPVAETLVRQLRAVHAGLEVETLVKSGEDGAPTNEVDDYLSRVSPEAAWQWADLGLAREPWRALRSDFAADLGDNFRHNTLLLLQ